MMKKILVLFNGLSAPWHITTFALNIAKQNNAEVQALFLNDETPGYVYPSDIASVQEELAPEKETAANAALQEKNIELFKTFCDDEKVNCYFEKNVSLKQLIQFSADAGVLVTNSHDDFQKYSLKDILAQSDCPVCLISVNATEIKTNVLLWDGTEDAMHAIEAYGMLFPDLCKKKNYLVTINEKGNAIKPGTKKMLQKFSNPEVVSLKGNLEKKLIEFLDVHTENAMVVMGAYGRSAVSMLFKPSLSNVVLNQSRTSLFIAHN